MAIALIAAGGTGTRTGNNVPKQFITVNDIPIIVYTMKNVQDSGCYSDMYVICADGWKDFIISYALQYEINIFRGTITGGQSRFESISNGISYISKLFDKEEIISLVDANRPLTPKSVFVNSIQSLDNSDLVLPLEPCYDSIYIAEEKNRKIVKSVDRTVLFKGQSPETLTLGVAEEIHQMAQRDRLQDLTTTAVMLYYGKNVSFIEGGSRNFKITTLDDLSIFKALVKPIV